MDQNKSKGTEVNELFHPDDLQVSVIPSYFFTQYGLLKSIRTLYEIDRFEIDACYGKGNLHKSAPAPIYKYDIKPKTKDTIQMDCRNMRHYNDSIKSIIFDPPFLITSGPSLKNTKTRNIMTQKYCYFKSLEELYVFYEKSLIEFYRVLQDKGMLIFKCQDTISGGKQYWSHIYIYNTAIKIGFYGLDLFILLAKNRPISGKIKRQQHARKYHCYFWIFRKE